jgi:hypothetical protein
VTKEISTRETEVARGNVAGETPELLGNAAREMPEPLELRAAWQRYRSREKERGRDTGVAMCG